jgi:hypothetical protein
VGGPPKSEGKRDKQPSEMEKQVTQGAPDSLEKLNKKCSFGCKKNSQGNVSFWKGYKLHLDVSDAGFPITRAFQAPMFMTACLPIKRKK